MSLISFGQNLFYVTLAESYAGEMTQIPTDTIRMSALRAECSKKFEPMLPFLRTVRLASEAEERRQHLIDERVLAPTKELKLFKYRLQMLISSIGLQSTQFLFEEFVGDVETFIDDPRPSIKVEMLDIMNFLAGAAQEDNARFTSELLASLALGTDEVYKKFTEIDTDSSGLLSMKECTGLMKALGIPLDLDEAQEYKLFTFIDIDGSGEIDYQEFFTFYSNPDDFMEWYRGIEQVGQRVKAWAGQGNPQGLTPEQLRENSRKVYLDSVEEIATGKSGNRANQKAKPKPQSKLETFGKAK